MWSFIIVFYENSNLDHFLIHLGIFQNLEVGKEGKVLKSEFCNGYINAINFIEEAIFTTKDKILDVQRLKSEYQKQLEDLIKSGGNVKNNFGIMKESSLSVGIIQASDLKPTDFGGKWDPFWVIEVDDQVAESTVKSNTLNPIWNENFSFSITTGKEVLHVGVMDKNKNQEDLLLGMVEVNISDFSNQKSADVWYDLQSNDTSRSGGKGRINLSLWWIHSKEDMLKELIYGWDDDIKVLEENQIYYEDRTQLMKIPMQDVKVKPKVTASQVPKYESSIQNMSLSKSKGQDTTAENDFGGTTLAKIVGTVLENERKWALMVENTSNKLSIKLGFDETPWYIN